MERRDEMKDTIAETIGIASNRICNILTHFPIVLHEMLDGPYFETEVFLCALLGASLPGEEDEIYSAVMDRLELYRPDADRLITDRMTVYEKVAAKRAIPCMFWSAVPPEEAFVDQRVLRMAALFGDFLVCPESAKDYSNYPWPNFKDEDLEVFTRVFIVRIIPEIFRFLAVARIKLALNEEQEG